MHDTILTDCSTVNAGLTSTPDYHEHALCTSTVPGGTNSTFLINDGRLPDDVKLSVFSEFASMKDLTLIAKGNRNSRHMVPYAIDMRFRALLRHYFGFSGSFVIRNFMRIYGVIIAGSEGLRLAQGDSVREDNIDVTWEPGNIDFYTPEGVSDQMVAVILDLGGEYAPPETVVLAAERDNHVFRKATKSITRLIIGDKKIAVHESTGRRAALAVLDSWSTCLTAMATADFVVVLYPSYTLNNRAILQGYEETFAGTQPLIAKYDARGMTHVDPYFNPFKSYCLADWATITESDKVCVLPMDETLWDTIPREFAGRFRWRATVVCYDYNCPVHNRRGKPKTLLQELREITRAA